MWMEPDLENNASVRPDTILSWTYSSTPTEDKDSLLVLAGLWNCGLEVRITKGEAKGEE